MANSAKVLALTTEVDQWLQLRAALLYSAAVAQITGDWSGVNPAPYSDKAKKISEGAYPIVEATVQEALKLYTENPVGTYAESIVLTRQVDLAESYRKQLLSRRSRKLQKLQHQNAYAADIPARLARLKAVIVETGTK